jgi:hypothetical protein
VLGFYFRVLRRVPCLIYDAATTAGALALLVATGALAFNKTLASDIAGWHGFSPAWAIAPCGLIVVCGLAKANYEEARLYARPTNRTSEPGGLAPIIAQPGSTIYVLPNVVRLPEPPPAPPGTQTEPESDR